MRRDRASSPGLPVRVDATDRRRRIASPNWKPELLYNIATQSWYCEYHQRFRPPARHGSSCQGLTACMVGMKEAER